LNDERKVKYLEGKFDYELADTVALGNIKGLEERLKADKAKVKELIH